MHIRTTLAALFVVCALGYAQDSEHHRSVNTHGDHVMGFSHEKTTHHFLLREDGGLIEVRANDSKDTESVDQIRSHLRHISQMFATGDFSAPMLIHSQNPPGTTGMKRLKKDIRYQFEDIDGGARVRITTASPEATKAIHQFLRFQISDHQTGDPAEVSNRVNR